MQEKGSSENKTELSSPESSPFSFRIIITEEISGTNSQCKIEVSQKDTIETYKLNNREHNSYLDLFEQLSKDYGLRLPQNRRPAIEYSFTAAYQELLSQNLSSEMQYGYGDPAVLRVEKNQNEVWYYLVTTSNDAPDSFPICRSKNLKDWEFVSFVFPKNNKPKWAADGEFISDYWAPEMHKVGKEFRIYFVARDKNTLELCIGMARSSNPEGLFIADDEPILKSDKIDPHVFVENNKNVFLFWKEDNNGIWPNLLIELLYQNPGLIENLFINKEDQLTASFIVTLWPWIQTLKTMESFLVEQILIEAVSADFSEFKKRLVRLLETQKINVNNKILSIIKTIRTPVYAQKLSDDGSALEGEKKLVLENDLDWEAHLVEGIWVTKYQDKYYMFYSGNDFSTDQYGIGVAIANNVFGPYKKIQKPILKSTEEWWAPGHPSVAIGLDGKHHLFLHAFFPNKAGYKEFRALLSMPLQFEKDKVVLL